ncbi:MAG: hypothetical protein K8R56_10625 [Candidatus Eisenbacteria bacterium]|nr:hypothetical protein [Candidatus Eisenbacteria bacterium]
MSPSLTSGLIAIAVVLIVGAIMRRGGSAPSASPGPRPGHDEGDGGTATREPSHAQVIAGHDEDEDDDDEPHVAAVTSDGEALLTYRHQVLMIPPPDTGEEWKIGAGMKAVNARGALAFDMTWQAGEMTGMRVVRGGADEAPWRLEGLGREGEYTPFGFETQDSAEAAKKLFERVGVVKLGEDEDGRLMPPSAEQFAEARRAYIETAESLAMDNDTEGPR